MKVKVLSLLLGVYIVLFLAACGSGNAVPRATTNQYGQLDAYQLGSSYSLPLLTQAAYATLCPGMQIESAMCTTNLNNIAKFGGFNINQIINNQLNINSVNEYNITYSTPGLVVGSPNNYLLKVASGGILIPQGIAPNQIKGVILYYHGADFNKTDWGPQIDPTSFEPNAALWATAGYIVVVPDFLGFGVDAKELHPYVTFPQINVLSGVNMLKATRQLLTKLGIPNTPLNLYITGYSEGGAWALWTSYMLQNNLANLDTANMQLKATAPMSGAYDLADAQIPFEEESVTTESGLNKYNIFNTATAAIYKPVLVSSALISYAYYNNLPCFELMYNQYCSLSNLNNGYNVPQLFEATTQQPSDGEITSYLYAQAESMQYSEVNNSIAAFTIMPFNTQLLSALESASLVTWQTTSPVSFIYLKQDSVVTNLNAINAYKRMSFVSAPGLVQAIPVNNSDFMVCNLANESSQESMECSPEDHPSATNLSVAALAVFESYP